MSESQLQQYDRLINEPSNDWDIYYWATGEGVSVLTLVCVCMFLLSKAVLQIPRSSSRLVCGQGTFFKLENRDSMQKYSLINSSVTNCAAIIYLYLSQFKRKLNFKPSRGTVIKKSLLISHYARPLLLKSLLFPAVYSFLNLLLALNSPRELSSVLSLFFLPPEYPRKLVGAASNWPASNRKLLL